MWLILLPRQHFCDDFSKMCLTKSKTIFGYRKTCSPTLVWGISLLGHYLPILCGFEVSGGVKIEVKIATFCDKKFFSSKLASLGNCFHKRQAKSLHYASPSKTRRFDHYLPILCGFEVSGDVKINVKIATFCDKKFFSSKPAF